MAEQHTSSTPQKSSADVKPSQAREEAERSSTQQTGSSQSRSSSGSSSGSKSQDQTQANARKGKDNDSLVGKSLEYNSGPGRSAYPSAGYATDAVNDLPHLRVHNRER